MLTNPLKEIKLKQMRILEFSTKRIRIQISSDINKLCDTGCFYHLGNRENMESYRKTLILLIYSILLMIMMSANATAGDWAESLIQTSDGGYAVAGATSSKGAGADDL